MDIESVNQVYDRIGDEPIMQLVTLFYDKVKHDTTLRPLYRDDLDIPVLHLQQYLIQRFGGPTEYEQNRGSPRLKFRHVPFPIGQDERDQWMKLMRQAVEESKFADYPEIKQIVLEFFENTSTRLINNKKFLIGGKST